MTERVGNVAVHHFGGSGPTLLLSHATGFHGWCYEPMARHLADRFRCVALDYRGHGDTPLPDGWVVDWPGYFDDAEAVAMALADDGGDGTVSRIYGFGHSLGGACLLVAAHRRPDRFAHLVLFEPIVTPPDQRLPDDLDPESVPIVMAARRRRATFGSYDEAFANFANKPPLKAFDPDALWAYVSHGFAPDPQGVRLKCDPAVETETFVQGFRQRIWELLPDIEIPVTVIAGTRYPDENTARMAPFIADELPAGRLVEMPALDHFGPMTDPYVVAGLVRDALQADVA